MLIYFDNASRTGVVRRLMGYLEPDGMFFLGHSESLNGVDVTARTLIPTVYCAAGSPAAAHAARRR